MEHKNFYETVAEANLRLRGTIVLYEGEPYEVLCITDHKGDGIFRIYVEETGHGIKKMLAHTDANLPTRNYSTDDHHVLGAKMDAYIDGKDNCPVLRKYMTSSGFNKFRPFPLGMYNYDGNVTYLERGPLRSTPQGLTKQMVAQRSLDLRQAGGQLPTSYLDLTSAEIKATIKGEYPPFSECVEQLKDPECANTGVGFRRNFALIRGPIDTLFLAYKDKIIGVLPYGDHNLVRLAKDSGYTREVVQELGIFNTIVGG